MSEKVEELAILVGRGNRLAEAGRIGEQFSDKHGEGAGEALFSARFDAERGDTLVVATSNALRLHFLRHTDWTEWYPGEPYPRSDVGEGE